MIFISEPPDPPLKLHCPKIDENIHLIGKAMPSIRCDYYNIEDYDEWIASCEADESESNECLYHTKIISDIQCPRIEDSIEIYGGISPLVLCDHNTHKKGDKWDGKHCKVDRSEPKRCIYQAIPDSTILSEDEQLYRAIWEDLGERPNW